MYTQAWNENMWERLRLKELEQTHANTHTRKHTNTCTAALRWDERAVIKMRSTGGLRKHTRHHAAEVCGNWLWWIDYHDFPGRMLTLSVTLTTVCQMKGKWSSMWWNKKAQADRKSKKGEHVRWFQRFKENWHRKVSQTPQPKVTFLPGDVSYAAKMNQTQRPPT